MVQVAISELKTHLSEYVSRVRAGKELVVTDRGKPVAKIVPIIVGDVRIPAHLALLERAGGVRLGTGRLPKGFWDASRPIDADGQAVAALLEERRATR